MADVRALLRAERQKRKVSHPHASYAADGKLHCNLCEVPIKSEAAWQGHLHTSQHISRSSRADDGGAGRGSDGGNKKRKASALDSPVPEERKKAKPIILDIQSGDKPDASFVEKRRENANRSHPAPHDSPQTEDNALPSEDVDATELANFEQELAQLEASAAAKKNIIAQPTISAAPMTAQEVAAQAREELSAQRTRRDAELEADKEDAANLLEDELEEMQSLEDRVRKLRERREALRRHGTEEVGELPSTTVATHDAHISDGITNELRGEGEDDNDDDDDDEDYDDWHFGRA